MPPKNSNPPPTGPRASRNTRSTMTVSRGGIQKQRNGPVRIDKDGDLDMATAAGRGRGRGVGRAVPPSKDSLKNGQSTTGLQKAILRGMGAGHAIVRGPRTSLRVTGMLNEGAGKGKSSGRKGGLDLVSIKGLKESKAALNQDGGVQDLLAFIERKATTVGAPSNEAVRIRKSRPEGDSLIISVRSEDTSKILRLNDYQFAGANLTIKSYIEPGGPSGSMTVLAPSEEAQGLKQQFTAILSRRYNPELKLLDLSKLGSDPELVNIGMFATNSTESKFFPALMKVCDSLFTSPQQKREAVVSVTIANNALPNITSVTTLSQTFPDIKNLDLSNNLIKDLRCLDGWRWKFRQLDHLVLTGNPLETAVPTYKDDILKWYPSLRTLNMIQMRSDAEVEAVIKGKLPVAILPPDFRDEANIGETFVKQFFPAYDTDRSAVAIGYYDAESSFSLSVNTSAPRAPAESSKSISWGAYIKISRNMTKTTHLPSRMSRLFSGSEAIRDVWSSLPNTKHPDLLLEPQKWCIECHSIPGLPDPSGQSAGGVGGLIIIVHGEFAEVDSIDAVSNISTRSFDRTFVLGPGTGIGGIRVVSDILVLRAYGGFEAWAAEGNGGVAEPRAHMAISGQLQAPEGFGVANPSKAPEQLQKEIMALDLGRRTGMTLEYSGMCLEQSGWNLEGAGKAFEQAKDKLPAEAFTSGHNMSVHSN